jgi:hypothetical protein
LVATQQEYLLALKGQRLLGGSEFPEVAAGARSLLAVTRQRLQLWDVPEHQIRDLERTGKVLTTLHVHSPITGTVMSKVALAGMRVGPGDDLYTIADLSHIWILADIYEYELPVIKVGQTHWSRCRMTLALSCKARRRSSPPCLIRKPGPPRCASSYPGAASPQPNRADRYRG